MGKSTLSKENPVNRPKSRLWGMNLRELAGQGVFDDTQTAEQRWIEAAERFAKQEETVSVRTNRTDYSHSR
jgi:hypothetical protein